MIKIRFVTLAKPVQPPDCGILTTGITDAIYEIYEDRDRRVFLFAKKAGEGTEKCFGIPFENAVDWGYYNKEDAGWPGTESADDETPVKRGPGRPPKQHPVLA